MVNYIVCELDDVLKSGYFESPLGYDNVDWFVDEVVNLEKKMVFYFRNTNKDIIRTQEYEEHYRNNKECQFCPKIFESDKVRDSCQLTGKYRCSAYNKCKINIYTATKKTYTIFIS